MSAGAFRILLLEDDPKTVEAIRDELRERVEVIVARNYTEALDHLYRTENLVAVVAHHNVRHGGGGARFMVEARRIRPDAYRLLYSTSSTASEDALTFADGFIVRPWAAGELGVLIDLALRRGISGATA